MRHLLTGIFAFLLLMMIFEYPAWTVFILGVLTYGLFVHKKTRFMKKPSVVVTTTSLQTAREKIYRLVREHHDFLKKSRKEGLIRNKRGEIDNSVWQNTCQNFVDDIFLPQIDGNEASAIQEYGLSRFVMEEIESPLA